MLNETFYLNPDDENSLKYYEERSKWCNENNATIQEIGTVDVEVEETYQDSDGEKTRIVTKTLRQFQIVAIPEPTEEKLQELKRAERDTAINSILWRVERYEQQVKLEAETTDSEETYLSILAYVQYLRDFTKQENWWTLEVPSFEEWKVSGCLAEGESNV